MQLIQQGIDLVIIIISHILSYLSDSGVYIIYKIYATTLKEIVEHRGQRTEQTYWKDRHHLNLAGTSIDQTRAYLQGPGACPQCRCWQLLQILTYWGFLTQLDCHPVGLGSAGFWAASPRPPMYIVIDPNKCRSSELCNVKNNFVGNGWGWGMGFGTELGKCQTRNRGDDYKKGHQLFRTEAICLYCLPINISGYALVIRCIAYCRSLQLQLSVAHGDMAQPWAQRRFII